jgi:hypothetical protein
MLSLNIIVIIQSWSFMNETYFYNWLWQHIIKVKVEISRIKVIWCIFKLSLTFKWLLSINLWYYKLLVIKLLSKIKLKRSCYWGLRSTFN